MRTAHLHANLPRHPLLRALVLVAGALLLAGVAAAGLLIGAIVVAMSALLMAVRRWRSTRQRAQPDPNVIEGEFTVVTPRPRGALPRPE